MKAPDSSYGGNRLARFLFRGSPGAGRSPTPESWPLPRPKAISEKEILVVDDDAVILRTTTARLEAEGYRVRTSTDPSEAIAAVGERRPDVILLDIDFPPDVGNGGRPSWDGFRLMYWLRGLANTLGTRYIVMTGLSLPELRHQALAYGAVAFFPKPLDFPALLDLLRRELDGSADSPRAALRPARPAGVGN